MRQNNIQVTPKEIIATQAQLLKVHSGSEATDLTEDERPKRTTMRPHGCNGLSPNPCIVNFLFSPISLCLLFCYSVRNRYVCVGVVWHIC